MPTCLTDRHLPLRTSHSRDVQSMEPLTTNVPAREVGTCGTAGGSMSMHRAMCTRTSGTCSAQCL